MNYIIINIFGYVVVGMALGLEGILVFDPIFWVVMAGVAIVQFNSALNQ